MSFLRRVHTPYVPSIDNYDELDADRDGNDNAKKGRRYAHAAAEQRRYRGVQHLPPEKKAKVKEDIESIASSLRRRIIRPTNNTEYERLREAEITSSESRGPAAVTLFHHTSPAKAKKKRKKNEGSYNVSEFADLLSVVEQQKHNVSTQVTNDAEDEALQQHKHTVRDTVLYQMRHDDNANAEAFVKDDMFSCRLLMHNEPSLCALMQMSQFDAAENALDKFKRYYPKQMTKRFGEFVVHFADECGLRLFCAYVAKGASTSLFAAFEMDCIQRYFLCVVFRVEQTKNVMHEARSWCDEALDHYKAAVLQRNTNTQRIQKPCSDLNKNDSYWALYDITMSKLLQNANVTFSYGYYTACQCVELAKKIEQKSN